MTRIETLEPEFAEKIKLLIKATEMATQLKWIITSGRRTMAEQLKLYEQGRTAPGKVVTNARPGSSAHNFGLAADLAPMRRDGRIWWEAPKSVWQKMADLAREMGMVSGFYFKTIYDAPHVEDGKRYRRNGKPGRFTYHDLLPTLQTQWSTWHGAVLQILPMEG